MYWSKKLVCLLMFVLSAFVVVAQEIYSYCDVYKDSKNVVRVKYGNNPTYISKEYQQQILCDFKTKKPIVFKSVVDCVNHMSLFGWEVVTSTHSNGEIRYVLRHKIESPYLIEGRLERDMQLIEEYEKNMKK